MNHLLKIVKESGINFSGSLMGTILNYMILMVITRFLSPKEYGVFVLAQAIVYVSLVFVLLGTPRALDRFIPLFNEKGEYGKTKSLIFDILRMALVTNLIVGASIFGFSKLISLHVFNELRLESVLKIMIFTLPMLSINEIVSYAFIGYKELRFQVYIQQLGLPLLKIMMAAICLTLGFGLMGWTWMYLFSVTGSSLIALYFSKKHIFAKFSSIPSVHVSFKNIFSYSWPLSFGLILIILYGQFDLLFLGYFRNSEEVAIYKIYLQVITIFSLVILSFAQIFKPTASELLGRNNLKEIKEIYQRISKWVFNINGIILSILLLFGPALIKIFFTRIYFREPLALFILATGNFLSSSLGPTARTLEAFGNTKLWLLNSILMISFNGGLNFVLIPKYGLIGAAISHSISLIIGGLAGLIEIYVLHGLQPFNLKHLKYILNLLLSSLITYLLITSFPEINLVRLIFLLVFFFCLISMGLYLSKTLDEVDLNILKTIKTRLIPR